MHGGRPGFLRAEAHVLRALRALVVPLLVALPPLVWVIEATRRASFTTLGRDQGIFQYVAWALRQGVKDYRDVRDVNGPLTHLVHMVFLALGGADEHRFRVLDLAITGLSFAVIGACLPGIGAVRAARGPSFAEPLRRPPWALASTERLGWALAAWVILSAQYLHYLYWDLAQRESFCDWFMLTSVALQLYAQGRPSSGPTDEAARSRTTTALYLLVGALSVIPWFGKPTYALFTVAQLVTLFIDRDAGDRKRLESQTQDVGVLSARRRAWFFALGGAVGALTQLAFLAAYADTFAFLRISATDVPTMYRFIWPRTPLEILTLPGYSTTAVLALVTSLVMLGLIVDGQLPRRALAVALVPLCGLGSVLAQGKGFPYHLHPVSAGLHLQWLLLVVWMWERLGARSSAPWSKASAARALRLIPFAAAAALTLHVALDIQQSPHLSNLWILAKGYDAEHRASRDYLVYFRDHDFFPWEMRQTATYLREHTRPTDRVQMYGLDPYLLFLAERLSATPYIYDYDLNADAALYGSSLPDGLRPTWEESQKIRAIRDAHEADFLARLVKDPPAAFVFMDKAPLLSNEDDAWLDFAAHNVSSAAWVAGHYRQTAAFGEDRVWMRLDLAEGIAIEGKTPPKTPAGTPTPDSTGDEASRP